MIILRVVVVVVDQQYCSTRRLLLDPKLLILFRRRCTVIHGVVRDILYRRIGSICGGVLLEKQCHLFVVVVVVSWDNYDISSFSLYTVDGSFLGASIFVD